MEGAAKASQNILSGQPVVIGPAERRYLIEVAGTDAAAIARAAGVDRALVYHVIAGVRKNRIVQEVIADLVGVPVERLFGRDLGRPRIQLAEAPATDSQTLVDGRSIIYGSTQEMAKKLAATETLTQADIEEARNRG